MFHKISSISLTGATSIQIDVEISATPGLPQETIIGLPDTVIKESRARIKSAILLSGFKFPPMSYVINLSPSDIQKRNISLELAMTVAVLSVTQQIRVPANFCFVGRVSLDGKVTPIRQILPLIYFFPNYLDSTFVISKENEIDIAPLEGLRYIAIEHLNDQRKRRNAIAKA
ncbi:MAG: magnesium chelatase domain-containing protein, partial [Candidatus Margulisiibacteriota bacterium]